MTNTTNLTENEIALEKEMLWNWKLNAPWVKELIAEYTIENGAVYSPEGKYLNNYPSNGEALLWVEKVAVNSFVWED